MTQRKWKRGKAMPWGTNPAALSPATGLGSFLADLHKLPAETPLNAEMAPRHISLHGRGSLDDPVILDVEGHRASHTAEWADGVGAGLLRFIPGPCLAHIIFAHEHQRPCRTYSDAVPAVDAGRIRQRNRVLG